VDPVTWARLPHHEHDEAHETNILTVVLPNGVEPKKFGQWYKKNEERNNPECKGITGSNSEAEYFLADLNPLSGHNGRAFQPWDSSTLRMRKTCSAMINKST